MEIEDRLSDLEWRLSYHKVMINVLALLLLASAGSRVWEQFSGPGELTVTTLSVVDAAGKQLVILTADVAGNGEVATYSPEGKKLVTLAATPNGDGAVVNITKSGKQNRRD